MMMMMMTKMIDDDDDDDDDDENHFKKIPKDIFKKNPSQTFSGTKSTSHQTQSIHLHVMVPPLVSIRRSMEVFLIESRDPWLRVSARPSTR